LVLKILATNPLKSNLYPFYTNKMILFKKYIPGIAWFFLVLILICLPGNQFPKTDDWLKLIYFDKWVHCGLFGMLAFLWMRPYAMSEFTLQQKWNTIIKITIAVSVWGLTTEFIQKYFIPFRSFDWWDWAADSVGAILALIVCNKIYLAQKKD
jgi:VanZ like family